ncbi:hypothetical protein AbraIFM66951_006568 [Aspergillus brasiliensis]|uniref:Ubiquitin-like domain-containing protein n=1 Tax=Aspergillus brasiliensis TaxID=319629 RepID=A0A9W6DJZ3_9EURO|nr:hypothetical protein AbraCBS73388_011489 [Aspergillus brasiliensis]GKZ44404.1 hypothetical protein AbraIFM66951_006568 [Aspergillus brasiliensis]
MESPDTETHRVERTPARRSPPPHEPSTTEEPQQRFLRFTDAVGRKYTFPFHLVNTWAGMQSLILEAFTPMPALRPQIRDRHYDLLGPDGGVILPSVWEHMVKPDMRVTMHMLQPEPEDQAEDKAARAAMEAAQAAASAAEAAMSPPRNPDLPPLIFSSEGVFSFSRELFAESGHSLHLAVFEGWFIEEVQTADITVSYSRGPTGYDDLISIESWMVGFYHHSTSGIVFEETQGPRAAEEDILISDVFELKDLEPPGVVILLRCQRIEEPTSISLSFNIRYLQREGSVQEKKMEQTVQLGRTESTSWTPLSWAAAHGWEDAVKALLQEQRIVQLLDHDGRSGLSWAAGNGQETVARLFLREADSLADKEDNEGRTPLSWAAENGHVNTIDLLLKQERVNANRTDHQGRAPLAWAAANGHTDAVLALLEGIKSPDGDAVAADNYESNFDNSPVSQAAQNGHEGTLRVLVEKIVQLPEKLPWARFYLHKAAQHGWSMLVKILIEVNVPVDLVDPGNDDRTPLCVAAENGQSEVVATLLKAGAAHSHRTTMSRDSPLGLATRSGHADAVELLLSAGASVHLANAQGEAPTDLAEHHPTLLRMIAAVEKAGRLAVAEIPHLHPSIDHEFRSTIIDFVPVAGALVPFAAEVAVDAVLKNPWAPITAHESASTSFRWVHLPANNLLMARLYGNPASAYRVLKSERWVDRQHDGTTDVHYARFMRPHCQAFPSASLWALDAAEANYVTDLVLFMPFVHWDVEETHARREAIANAKLQRRRADHTLTSDQKLVEAYITDDHPLHIRRTLDQYYYHTLDDTAMRDQDQVLGHYQMRSNIQPRILTMVDQLWLWVLKGEQGKPDTIVSCFPVLDMAYPDPRGVTNILRRVKLRLLDEPYLVQTCYDLAGLITATCSRVYLDRESTLSFGTTRSSLQFSEVYETEITDIIQEEGVLFGQFGDLSKSDLADISREIVLVSRVKSILDELNIMAMLFNTQWKVIKTMDSVVKSILLSDSEHNDVTWKGANNADSGAGGSAQRVTAIWGARNDPDDCSLPLAMVTASIDEIATMAHRAEGASQSLNFLIDLKLKQNSVMDTQESLNMTREATRQGRIVLTFTLTTIVFLPLSFMTSFFALNIRQFRTNAEGKLDLSYVSYIIFPISSLISAALIWIAFRFQYVEALWTWVTRCLETTWSWVRDLIPNATEMPGPGQTGNIPTALPGSQVGGNEDLEGQYGSSSPTVAATGLQLQK